jgi:hypothetical protein
MVIEVIFRIFTALGDKFSLQFPLDGFAKKEKTPVLSFRAQREISGIMKRFLVALLLEMTEIDFLRNHHSLLQPF